MIGTRGRGAIVLGVLAALAASAALAWACTPEAYIDLSPTSGSPGQAVTVHGSGFTNGPVEIHWNGASGPLLATATGPSFSVAITVPGGSSGVSYVYALARSSSSGVVGSASRAFQVTAAAPTAQKGGSGTVSPEKRAAAAAPAKGAAPRPAVGRSHSRALAAPPQPGQSSSPVVKAASGQPVFRDSVRRASLPASSGRGRAHAAGSHHRPAGSSSQRSATSDVWSGFGRSGGPLLGHGASLSAASDSGPAGQLGLGIGLLGLGLLGLVGSFAVAGVRRRRALASGRDRSA